MHALVHLDPFWVLSALRRKIAVRLGYCPQCGERRLGTRTWYDSGGHRRWRTYCHLCAWHSRSSRS